MTELSVNEQRYLLSAFGASPREWFRPGTVSSNDFSARQIDEIVGSLARRGLLDAQPNCHARLTDLGRKLARRMDKLARGEGRRWRPRQSTVIAIASVGALVCLVIVLMVAGIL